MRNRLCANCAHRYPMTLDRCPECDTHAAKPADKPETHQTTCLAHGCPLPGTSTDSTQGSGSWVCGAHRTAASSDWQAVTQRIRQHQWLYAMVLRAQEIGLLILAEGDAHKASVKLIERDVPSLAFAPGEETAAQWAMRLQSGYWTLVITGQCESKPKPRPWLFRPGNVSALAPKQVAA